MPAKIKKFSLAEQPDHSDYEWQDWFALGDYPQGEFNDPDWVDQMCRNYDPSIEEAVINYDHEEDGDAKGRIEAFRLDRERGVAQFKPKHVTDEAKKDNRDQKRFRQSAEFYPFHESVNGPYPKGVALLGVTPPQVRGLKPIEFKANDHKYVGFASGKHHYVTLDSQVEEEEDMSFTEKQAQKMIQDALDKQAKDFSTQIAALKSSGGGSTTSPEVVALQSQVTDLTKSLQSEAHQRRIDWANDQLESLVDDTRIDNGQRKEFSKAFAAIVRKMEPVVKLGDSDVNALELLVATLKTLPKRKDFATDGEGPVGFSPSNVTNMGDIPDNMPSATRRQIFGQARNQARGEGKTGSDLTTRATEIRKDLITKWSDKHAPASGE